MKMFKCYTIFSDPKLATHTKKAEIGGFLEAICLTNDNDPVFRVSQYIVSG